MDKLISAVMDKLISAVTSKLSLAVTEKLSSTVMDKLKSASWLPYASCHQLSSAVISTAVMSIIKQGNGIKEEEIQF